MKKIIIPILLGIGLVAVSCQKMLDIPQKGVIDYDSFYASDDDAAAALNNMYAQYLLGPAGVNGITTPEMTMTNYAADDILAGGGYAGDHDPFRYFDEFRYANDNRDIKACYSKYYQTIYAANLIISNFTNENSDQTDPKWHSAYTEQCVEEARVMRAYMHLQAAIFWNRPPLVDRLLKAGELPTNAESQSQILTWVVSECDKAINSGKLPVRKDVNDKDATARMSVGFAQFVAGKAAMFNDDPATARKYLGDLIASGKYALVPTEEFWTNFHVAGDGNPEKIFAANVIEDPAFYVTSRGALGSPTSRVRNMNANTLNWKSDNLPSAPSVMATYGGWGGGMIQEGFAKKFYAHDGNSARRRACFLTADEWLYEIDWAGSDVNDGTLEQKKADPQRGISTPSGYWSHSAFFEWKNMVFINPPKILTGGKEYPSDNVKCMGAGNYNQTNNTAARYAEALLLYAEACIGSADAPKGLEALQAVQKRSGSGKVSTELTFANVMEEKQYEMWFEGCRFPDLVRWSKKGLVNLDDIYNKSGIHENSKVPTCFDEFFIEGKPGYQKEHKLYVEYNSSDPIIFNKFEDKYMYYMFPRDYKTCNPNLKDVLGWEYLN